MKKAGDLLSNILDASMMKKAQNYSGLFSSWEKMTKDAAIPAAFAHSRIVELDRHIILVETDHPGWIQLLQTKQTQLLKAARRRFPDLTLSGISFRLCRDPASFAQTTMEDKPDLAIDGSARDSPASSTGGGSPPANCAGEDTGGKDPYDKIHDEDFKKSLKQLEKSIQERNNNL